MEENKFKFTSNTEENKDLNNPKKALPYRVIIIAASVLLVALIVLTWLYFSKTSESEGNIEEIEALKAENAKLALENEAIQLGNEFKALDEEFQAIENQSFQIVLNDSIAQEYEQAKEKLEELRKELKDEKNKNAKRIKELQSEMTFDDCIRG